MQTLERLIYAHVNFFFQAASLTDASCSAQLTPLKLIPYNILGQKV